MKNLSVYAVRYDANTDVGGGANDLSAHLQQTANNCPDTKLVVGGYSLGAGVVDTALGVPGPVQIGNLFSFDNPVPPEVGDHIRAIVTFGNIVNRFAPCRVWPAPMATECWICATTAIPSAWTETRTPGSPTPRTRRR